MTVSEPAAQSLPVMSLSSWIRLKAVVVLLCALIVAYAVWLAILRVPTNVDVSWLIVVCERLLNGERLIIDVMEVNPPFSIWLYMPFVLFEHLLGGRVELWMTAGVILAGISSVGVSARILCRADETYSNARTIWVAPVALFLVLCLFPGEFGQREQFATIAILPWLALQIARQYTSDFEAGVRWEHVLAGLCAAIVVMVKPPHFLLAFALPSLYLALGRRSWKPLFIFENILGAVIVASYLAYIIIFQRPFLNEALPFARDLYLPMRLPLLDILLRWPDTILLLVILTIITAGGLKRMDWMPKIIAISALGFIPSFIAMGKAWPNHALPMLALALLGFVAQLTRVSDFRKLALASKLAAVTGCLLIIQSLIPIHRYILSVDNGALELSIAAIKQVREKPTVLSLASRLQVAYPLARDVDGTSVSRFPSAWAVYNADVLAHQTQDPQIKKHLETLRDEMIGQFADEIAENKPDIILYNSGTGSRWDVLMLHDPRIASELNNYKIQSNEPSIVIYVRRKLVQHSSSETEARQIVRNTGSQKSVSGGSTLLSVRLIRPPFFNSVDVPG